MLKQRSNCLLLITCSVSDRAGPPLICGQITRRVVVYVASPKLVGFEVKLCGNLILRWSFDWITDASLWPGHIVWVFGLDFGIGDYLHIVGVADFAGGGGWILERRFYS